MKKLGLLTAAMTLVASTCYAAPASILERGLADWVSIVAEVLSFVCLAMFILYTGKYLNSAKGGATGEENVKVTTGVRNGIMTALVGIGLCQAVIIVAQAIFAK